MAEDLLEFDDNGNLKPGMHECTIHEFKNKFVDEFPTSESRNSRFDGFLGYSRYVCEIVKSTRKQLINGSFTTIKLNPNDVDFIIVLNNNKITSEEKKFIKREIILNRRDKRNRDQILEMMEMGVTTNFDVIPCCDRFFIYWREESDKNYKDYLKDKKYWCDCFGHTRENSEGKRLPKGLVELTMNLEAFEGI